MNNISPTWKKHFQPMGMDYDDMKYNIWSTVTWGHFGKKTHPLYETIIPNIVFNPTHPLTSLKAHISSPVWLFRSHPPVFALPEEMGSPWKYRCRNTHAILQDLEYICLYPRGDPWDWYLYLHLLAFCCFRKVSGPMDSSYMYCGELILFDCSEAKNKYRFPDNEFPTNRSSSIVNAQISRI